MISLTRENVKEFALKVYDNPCCKSALEFEEDYQKIKYIKILFNKFLRNKEVNYRLLLNHIICFTNVFPGDNAAKILLTECDKEHTHLIITILYFLKRMPPYVFCNNTHFILNESLIEWNFLEKLKSL